MEYWATRSSARSFARTAHSFACSGLLSSLAPSAALTQSLAQFAHSLARGTVNYWIAIYSVFFLLWPIVQGSSSALFRLSSFLSFFLRFLHFLFFLLSFFPPFPPHALSFFFFSFRLLSPPPSLDKTFLEGKKDKRGKREEKGSEEII